MALYMRVRKRGPRIECEEFIWRAHSVTTFPTTLAGKPHRACGYSRDMLLRRGLDGRNERTDGGAINGIRCYLAFMQRRRMAK